MAIQKPEGADMLLGLIGASWPEVNEDLYREMADSLRAFADDLADDGQLANNHVTRLLSTGSGQSFDALNNHWNTVLGRSFSDIVTAARTIADAMDATALVIAEAKLRIVYVLADLSKQLTTVTFTAAAAFGNTPAGATAMAAAKTAIDRYNQECVTDAVRTMQSTLSEPSVTSVESITPDRLRGGGSEGGAEGGAAKGIADGGAAGAPGGVAGMAGAAGGGAVMDLASAGGGVAGGAIAGIGSGLVDLAIDHDEHVRAGNRLGGVSTGIHDKTSASLGKAAAHHARTRGRGSVAQGVDPLADRLLGALRDATGHMGEHIGRTLPKTIRQISVDYKNTDDEIRAAFARLRANSPSPSPSPAPSPTPSPFSGSTADSLPHHRTDPLRVDHLTPDQQRTVSAEEARALADRARAAE